MPDRTADLLPVLQQHHLPEFDLGDEFIYPHYDGHSILNVPASICSLLGAPGLGAQPLVPAYLEPLGDDLRRVILIVVDALAFHRLRRWIETSAPVWGDLAQAGILAPITSITPSTTSAAITSLWTGRSAAEHGITGYEMWMKEYGVVANTILHTPITFQNDAGSLARAGFEAGAYLPFPTLGAHLALYDIPTIAFQHYSILDSGLSKMYFKHVTPKPYANSSDLWVNLRLAVENPKVDRLYCYVYWSDVDTFSHFYGPDDERTEAGFAAFSADFKRLFLNKLSPHVRSETAVLLAADHGQISTQPDPFFELASHPNLARRLHIQPTGENRLAYLYPRSGQAEAVREYLERTWPGAFRVVDSAYAVASGLFGPGEPHPSLLDRVGDFIAIARRDAYLWWAAKENWLIGRHGGLSSEEMLVPFLAARL